MLQRELEAVDLDPVAAIDELLRLCRVAFGIRAAGQPERAVAPLGRAQGRIRVDVAARDLEPASVRLEDRAAGKLVGPVAEHRPVRDLGRRRASRADRVQHAARTGRAEPVEIRRRGGLVAGAPAEHVVRAIG